MILLLFKLMASISMSLATPKKQVLAEVKFAKGSSSHEYVLLHMPGLKPEYELKFMDEKKRMAAKVITPIQAQRIQADLTKMIWDKQFRTPASQRNCQAYVSLKSNKDQATICLENSKLLGRAFGVLNGLNAIYR